MGEDSSRPNRREFVKILGGSSVAGAASLSGCLGGSDEGTPTPSEPGGSDGSNGSDGGSDGGDATETEAGSVSRGGQLDVAIAADPPAPFHPHRIRSSQGVTMARTYASSLVVPGPEGELRPQIAASVEASEDARTFVVTLRDGITFHPPYDRQLTAEDVVENFRRILDEDYGSPSRANFLGFLAGDGIDPQETVRATGDLEVTFELDQPFADFLHTMANVFIVPMEAVDEYGEDFGTMDTGTWAAGPFQFTEGTKQDHYTFEAFDGYFETGEDDEPLPYLDGVRFDIVPEASTRLTQLQTGEVHLADSVPPNEVESLRNSDAVTVESTPSVTRACNFINQANDPVFQKREVREAMMHAINRQAVIDVVYNGFAEPGWGVFPPWHWAHDEEATQTYPYDPERARQLLEEAGETDLSFECLVPNNPPFTDIATVVQQNYSDVGIDMQVSNVEESAAWDPVLARWGNDPPGPSAESFEANIQTLSVNMYADSFAFWKYHTGHFLNVTYYDESDDAIEEARQTTERSEREELYAELEAEATEYIDRIGVVWPNVVQGRRNAVQNYSVYPNSRIVVGGVWLDE